VNNDHGALWLLVLAAMAVALPFTWMALRVIADRYPRKVLLGAECVALLTWWGFLSHPPIWPTSREGLQHPLDWWRESLHWLGIPDGRVSGLVVFSPVAIVLLVSFGNLNRRNALREIPSIVVGRFAPAPDASEAPHHTEAALITNIVTKRVAQCLHASRRPTTVPGAPTEVVAVDGMARIPGTSWAAAATWLLRLLTPVRCWDVTGTVLRQADWVVLATVVDRSTQREVLTLRRHHVDLTRAAEEVASTVAAHAFSHASVVSEWASWDQPNGHGLDLHQKAQKLLRDHESTPEDGTVPAGGNTAARQPYEEARDLLARAAKVEPRNLLVRLELAKTQELLNPKRLDALVLYLRAVADYPCALQSLYRAAIAFQAFSAHDLEECPARRNDSQCEHFNRLWSEVSQQVLPAREVRPCLGGTLHRDEWTHGTCVYQKNTAKLTRDLLGRTLHGLRWWRRLCRVISPTKKDPTLIPAGIRATQFRRSVKISLCGQEAADLAQSLSPRRQHRLETRVRRLTRTPYQQAGFVPSATGARLSLPDRMAHRLGASWLAVLNWFAPPPVGWQAHYNAACFYSLLLRRAQELPETPPGSTDTDRLAWTSLQHLRHAVYDSAGILPVSSLWLRRVDPDLDAVRVYQRDPKTPKDTGSYWKDWMDWMTTSVDLRSPTAD
jgi:hypothetical protein